MKVERIDRAKAAAARQSSRQALGRGRLDQLSDDELVVLLADVRTEVGKRIGRRNGIVSPGQLHLLSRAVEPDAGQGAPPA